MPFELLAVIIALVWIDAATHRAVRARTPAPRALTVDLGHRLHPRP